MLERKLNLRKLLFKLTKGCVFSVTEKLLRQVDICPMGGPIYVVFADVFICKIELDVVYLYFINTMSMIRMCEKRKMM